MPKRNQPIDSGFDVVAPFYDALSRMVFGNALRVAQAHWLTRIPPRADILIFGGGSGWLLARVLAICNPRTVIYIDASPAMMALARQKVRNSPRVDFRIGTETAVRIDDQVDVVITPFILDLFTNHRLQTAILPPLYQSLRPQGLWVSTDFLKPTVWWQRFLLWVQYRFFRSVSQIEATQLPPWVDLLTSLPGLKPDPMAAFFGGMIGSGCWQKQVAIPEGLP
ncbi:hypothetical protein GCM10027347_49020 [Larkinella harenae]